MRRHWLLALLSSLAWAALIAFYAPSAHAYPAVSGGTQLRYWYHSSTEPNFASPEAACAAVPADWAYFVRGVGGSDFYGYWTSTSMNAGGYCRAYFTNGSETDIGLAGGYVSVLSCPSGGTLSGASCTCPSGQTDSGTACVAPTCTAGETISSGYMDVGSSITARSSSSLYCSAGCEFTYSGPGTLDVRIVGGVKRYFAPALYTGNGQACDTVPAPPPPAASSALPPNTCASGQYGGTVNGTWRCFDRTTGEETVKADDDTGVKKDETTTTNPDGTVTTRTTETTRNADGTTSTTTTTRTCDSSGNCSSTTSGGSGSGSSGGSGGGGSGEPECVAGTAGCATLGGVAAETLPNVTRALSITRDSGWEHSSTCPADKVLNLAAVTLVVPFTMLCDVADMARPIVIGVAWVIAVSGFFGLASKR